MQIAQHVAGAAEAPLLALDMQDRDRRFRRNAFHPAADVVIEHDVADAENTRAAQGLDQGDGVGVRGRAHGTGSCSCPDEGRNLAEKGMTRRPTSPYHPPAPEFPIAAAPPPKLPRRGTTSNRQGHEGDRDSRVRPTRCPEL